MRIIAGQFRGRHLKAPKGLATRPVLAKVREALFNVLGDVDGLRVLDLYAGTGAVGLEALSRGAQSAVFVDSAGTPCRIIRENLDALGCAGKVIRADAFKTITRFSREELQFDLLFADPPYDSGLAGRTVEDVCTAPLIAPGGVLAITVLKKEHLPENPGGCERVFDRIYDDTRLAIYKALPVPTI